MISNRYIDDAELVSSIADGSSKALEEAYNTYHRDVFRHAYALLSDHQMAEGATQETFIKLWNNAHKWKPQSSLKTWLFAICRNHCLDQIRERKSDLKKEMGLYQEHLIQKNTGNNQQKQTLDKSAHQKTISNAFFLLPERQREALALVYYNDMKNLDAAKVLGLKADAFDSLLARARKKMRDILKDETDLLEEYIT